MLLGQMGFQVSLLVDLTALDHRSPSPRRFHRGVQGFGSVQNEQRRYIRVHAPLCQLFQQSGHNPLIFRGPLP